MTTTLMILMVASTALAQREGMFWDGSTRRGPESIPLRNIRTLDGTMTLSAPRSATREQLRTCGWYPIVRAEVSTNDHVLFRSWPDEPPFVESVVVTNAVEWQAEQDAIEAVSPGTLIFAWRRLCDRIHAAEPSLSDIATPQDFLDSLPRVVQAIQDRLAAKDAELDAKQTEIAAASNLGQLGARQLAWDQLMRQRNTITDVQAELQWWALVVIDRRQR